MSMNVEYIKSALKMPARPTLFDVEISGSSLGAISTDVLKFTCKSAGLPDDNIGRIDVPYYGRKIPYAGDRAYGDWNTTIIMNNDWTIYKQLVAWKSAFNGPETNVASVANMTSYKCDGFVTMYDPTGARKLQIKMVGLFPYNVQELQVSWETTDSTADLNVTWFLDYWYVVS
jgi:hypothetical protein